MSERDPLDVACPKCESSAGQPCYMAFVPNSREDLPLYHREREEAADKD